MARKLRTESNNGFYHIRDIGVDHFYLFEDQQDMEKFRRIMTDFIKNSGVSIVAYCIMPNHFHILAAGEKSFISAYMKNIKERFAQWYNFKHHRSGPLFDSRYRCDAIKDMGHFWETIRYIHLNPLRAGLVKTVDEYKFCSYNCYVGMQDKLVDPSYVLSQMDETDFIAWHSKIPNFSNFENFTRVVRLTDEQALEMMDVIVGKDRDFGKMDKKLRNIAIAELRRQGLAIRQIARLTGIPRWVVEKVKS